MNNENKHGTRTREEVADLTRRICDSVVRLTDERDALAAELAAIRAAGGEAGLTGEYHADVNALLGRVAAMAAELEKARVDAERYRWLRNKAVDADGTYPMVSLTDDSGEQVSNWLFGHAVDKVVDAAIAAESDTGANSHD